MLHFPHCAICCPIVAFSKQPDLSIPAKKRTFKRKISRRKYRYLCNQGESQSCCRYKSKNKSPPKRHCRLSVENCHASRSPRGQTTRRRSGRRSSSPQRSSIYSGATWSSPSFHKEVPPNSSLLAPHVERKTNVIVIDGNATISDNCPVEDAQQDPVCHTSEQPIGGTRISSENLTHPPNHSQLAQCGSQVNASRQGQDPVIPHFFQIEPLGIRLSSDPQPGIPSSPLKKPPQVLLQE